MKIVFPKSTLSVSHHFHVTVLTPPSTSWPPDDFPQQKGKLPALRGWLGGYQLVVRRWLTEITHLLLHLKPEAMSCQVGKSFLSQTFQKKWFYTLLSRKVQVSKLKVPVFFYGPFCRFYKRSTSKIKWPDHQMLAVLEVADFDFWVAGSNSLSVHCHFPLPSLRLSYLLKMKGFEQERRSSLPVLLFHSQCCRTNTDEDHDDNEENNNEHWSRWRCSSVLPRPLRWDSGIPRHKGCVTLNFN